MKTARYLVTFLLMAGPFLCVNALSGECEDVQALRRKASQLVAGDSEKMVIRGRDGWLFFRKELRHIAAGKFWGERAAEVSRATRPEWADPLPAIVDFSQQCQKAGARLIFVPVPPKAVIYPDKLPDSPIKTIPEKRLDAVHAEFLDLLGEKGVEVLDLTPSFLGYRRKHSDDPEAPRLYCKHDTHWSPKACQIAATLLNKRLAETDLSGPDKKDYEVNETSLKINGDLREMIEAPDMPQETLRAEVVTGPADGPPKDWRESPVLCVGDSHLLVFHTGGKLHGKGAGFTDHLAHQLGFPPDVVGVRGSGATPSRIALFRRRDNLAGKKVVIWCMTSREFTETRGWRKVPVVR
jgi:alginate O-acetyltransferase complex protein AlgJ